MGIGEQLDAVVFAGAVAGVGTISLASCRDGGYVILRNGRALEGCRWRADQSASAVAAFRRLMNADPAQLLKARIQPEAQAVS